MKKSNLRTSLGCALLGSWFIACGGNTSPIPSTATTSTSKPVPLSTVAVSAETRAATGAATWQLYKAKPTVPNAENAFEMVARSARGKVLHAMKVQIIREPVTGEAGARGAQASSSKPHMLIDGKGNVLESTLSVSALNKRYKSRIVVHDVSLSVRRFLRPLLVHTASSSRTLSNRSSRRFHNLAISAAHAWIGFIDRGLNV